MLERVLILLTIVLVFIAACAAPPIQHGAVEPDKDHVAVTVIFNPEIYPHFFGVKYPQMAVWAKLKGKEEVRTIYVTEKGSKDSWTAADNRPSSVPVWYGVRKREATQLQVDAVSGATPGGKQFAIEWQVPDGWAGEKIEIYLEGNVSFDYNDTYLKDAPEGAPGFSGVNGQPSLIWQATLDTSLKNETPVPFEILGHGSTTGEDHEVAQDLAGITTAKDMFLRLDARFAAGGSR